MTENRPILEDRRICVFLNHKGGVSKTTSVANIGARLAEKGYCVLLVDLDAQANLTSNFLQNEEEAEWYIHEGFINPRKDISITNIHENLYILPSSLLTATVESNILTKVEREKLLKKLLDKIVKNDIFDIILVDCPPSLGEIAKNALVAAQTLIVPITAEAFPLIGFQMLEDEIQIIKEGLNPTLEINKILVTRYNKQSNLNKNITGYIQENYAGKVFETRIRNNIKVSEAQLRQKTIFEYAPDSPAAQDYAAVTEELLNYLTGEI